MTRYWVIAPFHSGDPDVWDAVWAFDLENGVISIGWGEVGDVSRLEKAEIRRLLCEKWPNYTPGAATNAAGMLHNSYQAVKPGDYVIARRGLKHLAAIGKVKSSAYYDPSKLRDVFKRFGPDYERIVYPNHIDVEWLNDLRDRGYDEQVFGMTTIYGLPEEKFRSLTKGEYGCQRAEVSEHDTPAESGIASERCLEELLVSNLDSVFQGRLVLFSDPKEGPIGQQYPTDVGPIDVLAQDAKTSDFVVIELKKGRPADSVVGQVLRYMGWVAENLCAEGQEVRGIIICREPDAKLNYALKMVKNVSVKYYRIDLRLSDEP